MTAQTALNEIQTALGYARLDPQAKRDYLDYKHDIMQAWQDEDQERLYLLLKEFSAYHAYAVAA